MAREQDGMRWIDGGTFRMGSASFYAEEAPVHRVTVDGFWIDRHPITVRQFRRFVAETGHVTVAERPPDPAQYPDADPAPLTPGSLVFRKAPHRVSLDDHRRWWTYMPGACWRHPEGPGSDVHGRDRHPVTHIAHEDAAAYAAWAGRALPTEAEWEYAARGGLDGAVFAWGDEERPGGRLMANTWQGEFPWQNRKANGYEGTSPVGSFPPNGYGLYDVCGNVWEWTDDFFTPRHPEDATSSCCIPANPRVASPERSYVADQPGAHIPRRVDEFDMGSSKRNWPLARGFDRFYGFIGGEANQWYPDLVEDNHYIDQPYFPEEGYHLSKDLADKALEMIRTGKQSQPDKPWYMFFCLGANHAPHHAPQEWIDRYKGKFDDGYEAYREWVLGRMIEKGILPEGTELTPINPMPEDRTSPADRVRPWDTLRRREAAVQPDGRGLRGLQLLHRPSGRAHRRLPRAVRPARQHADHLRRRQRCVG